MKDNMNNSFGFLYEMNDVIYKNDMVSLENTKNINIFDYNSISSISESIEIPYKYLDDTFSTLLDLGRSVNELEEFFEKVYTSPKITDVPSSIKLLCVDEIGKIKPQYLKQYINTSSDYIEKALNGGLKEEDIAKISTPEYIKNIKKQIVSCKCDIFSDKDMIKKQNFIVVKTDRNLISTTILPYIRSFNQMINDMDKLINADIRSSVSYAISTLKTYAKTTNKLSKNGKISPKTMKSVNYVIDIISHNLLDLIKYMIAMTIRKMNIDIHNMTEYIKLQDTLLRYYPGGSSMMHESVLNGDFDFRDEEIVYELINGKNNIFDSVIDKVYNKYKQNMIQKNDKFNIDDITDDNINDTEYDNALYSYTKQILDRIMSKIMEFYSLIEDPDISIDEIIQQSKLDKIFTSKSGDITEDSINRINNISKYLSIDTENEGQIFSSIMAELNDAKGYLAENALIIQNIYNLIIKIRNDIGDNINNKYTNYERNKETIEFLRELEKRFKNYVLLYGHAFIDRILNLANELDSVDDDITSNDYITTGQNNVVSSPIEVPGIDYNEFAYESMLESQDDMYTYENNLFLNEYMDQLNQKRAGVVFEAPPQNDTNTGNTASTGAKPTDNNNGANNSSSSTPKVTDTSQQNNAGNNDPNNKNGNNSQSTGKPVDKNFAQDIIGKMQEFIKKLKNSINTTFSKIDKNTKKSMKDSNLEFLNKHKNYLAGKNYSTISIDILPFTETNPFVEAEGAIKKINGLNLGTMKDPAVLKSSIFSFTKNNNIGKTEDGELGNVVTNYLKFGISTVPKTKKISGSAVKALVDNAIDYCTNYYNTAENAPVYKAGEDVVNQISNKATSDTTITTDIVNKVNSYINIIITSSVNASRDKVNAYMSVLNQLIPAEQKAAANNNTNNNQNNNNQNANTPNNSQQNNNQNQNNTQ